ncbi:MAG: methylenetetrahydrofolate reductase C-terminal domain-containing protein [bacterium]
MIVAERKPIEEIIGMIGGHKNILIVGCGTCVTVCLTGGEKEVGLLSSALKMAARNKFNKELSIKEAVTERQCEREFVDELRGQISSCDAVLSMACAAGVQTIAEMFPKTIVLPAMNTTFLANVPEQGVWAEVCGGCGDCILHKTGGICPIIRCSKSLLNGPCGGSQNGKCEIDSEIECAWQLIYDRLKGLGRLDILEAILPPKNWTTSRDGGPRKMVREDVKL